MLTSYREADGLIAFNESRIKQLSIYLPVTSNIHGIYSHKQRDKPNRDINVELSVTKSKQVIKLFQRRASSGLQRY